jgi:hypothetical protein
MDLKTIEYSFSASGATIAIVNNTLTAFAPITMFIPDMAPGGGIRKAILTFTADDVITATGGSYTVRRLQIQVGALAVTGSWNNTNTYTNSGENISLWHTADATLFLSQSWGPATQSLDLTASFQMNQSTGTTTGLVNACLTLQVTYEYNESSSAQIKTVYIPLDASGSAQPLVLSQTFGSVPALDTYLPESGKTYRDIFIVNQANTSNNTATTNYTASIQVGSSVIQQTALISGSLASDRWRRFVYKFPSGSFNTAAQQDFKYANNIARDNHAQMYMGVTYTYDETGSTSIMNSLLLPLEIPTPGGGPTSTDFQRASRQIWVQEANPSFKRLAFYMFWDQQANIGGLAARIGTGSFIQYNDVASVMCGGNGLMIRNDTASIVRGRNLYSVDVYRTDATDLMYNLSGYFILNYTSDKHPSGSMWHNKTIRWNLANISSSAATLNRTLIDSTSPPIPIPGNYPFINALGTNYCYVSDSTSNPAGTIIQFELTKSEGAGWSNGYIDVGTTDPETGLRQCYSQMRDQFTRWYGDPDTARADIKLGRRWNLVQGNAATAFHYLDTIITYHRITYNISGSITGGSGALVSMSLLRPSDELTLITSSLSGNGPFNLTWYDNTEPVYVVAKEFSTVKGNISIVSTGSNSSNPFGIALGNEQWF